MRSPRMLGNFINPLNSQLAMTAVTINLNPIIKLTDDQFYHLCRVNPDVKEVLEDPTELSGEDVLPGFVLDLQIVWE